MTILSGPHSAARPVVTRPRLMVVVALAVGAAVDLLVLRHPVGLGAASVGLVVAGGGRPVQMRRLRPGRHRGDRPAALRCR